MLEKQRLGIEIKKLRKMKKLTQKQLAHNICNQSEISRIEAGESFPSMDILNLLANKLQIPIAYFFEVLIHEEVEDMRNLKYKIINFSSSKNYQELYDFITLIFKKESSFHPEIEKYLLWQYYVAKFYLKKTDADYCLTELLLLLRKKTIGMDILLDLQIKNSIANIMAEDKQFNKSTEVFQEILNTDLKSIDAEKLKLKVFYNFGKMLFLKKDFESSLLQTNRGIELSITLADMSLLGHFYYQKGAILEELSYSFKEIAFFYQKAEFFFEILGLSLHTQIILGKKEKFLLDKI